MSKANKYEYFTHIFYAAATAILINFDHKFVLFYSTFSQFPVLGIEGRDFTYHYSDFTPPKVLL